MSEDDGDSDLKPSFPSVTQAVTPSPLPAQNPVPTSTEKQSTNRWAVMLAVNLNGISTSEFGEQARTIFRRGIVGSLQLEVALPQVDLASVQDMPLSRRSQLRVRVDIEINGLESEEAAGKVAADLEIAMAPDSNLLLLKLQSGGLPGIRSIVLATAPAVLQAVSDQHVADDVPEPPSSPDSATPSRSIIFGAAGKHTPILHRHPNFYIHSSRPVSFLENGCVPLFASI